MTQKKENSSIGSVIVFLIQLAIVMVVSFRKEIFASESLMFNLFEEDLAQDTAARIIKTIYYIAIGGLIIKIADAITLVGDKFKNNKTKTTLLLLGNVLKYASAVGVLFVGLRAWGIDTTAIATGAGVVTLIVGLGCQSMISDIVSGIFILFEGDIQVGDIVVIDGWRGTVKQIGLRRTKIEDASGNINIINNSSISNIINNTRDLSWASASVVIDYKENIENVEKVLRDSFDDMKKTIPTLAEGPFYLGITELASYGYRILIGGSAKEEDLYSVQREMNRYLLVLFEKHDITIAAEHVSISNRDLNLEKVAYTEKEIAEAKAYFDAQRKYTKNIEDNQNR